MSKIYTASRRERRRRGFQWPVALVLTIVWMMLWGDLSIANAVSGLLISTVIILVFPLPPIVFTGRIHPIGLAVLVGRFTADLLMASFQVAGQALRLGTQPRNAVVGVQLYSRSDLYLTITAELLSLVPGSLVVEAHRATSTLYLHILGVRDEADVELARTAILAQEYRVMQALASPSELEAFHLARSGGDR
ncbi:MAG TPA: Na+/H+ antiporter subunit E [Jiangellaceae bacterium]|nr:Na+/H+ antiporter subunit E [Jiangellaceae bacterium]